MLLAHLPEQLKLKQLAAPNVGKDAKQLKLPYVVDRNLKRSYHFGKLAGNFFFKEFLH